MPYTNKTSPVGAFCPAVKQDGGCLKDDCFLCLCDDMVHGGCYDTVMGVIDAARVFVENPSVEDLCTVMRLGLEMGLAP